MFGTAPPASTTCISAPTSSSSMPTPPSSTAWPSTKAGPIPGTNVRRKCASASPATASATALQFGYTATNSAALIMSSKSNHQPQLELTMKKYSPGYTSILAMSHPAPDTSHRFPLVVKPLKNQGFDENLLVECNSDLKTKFPAGTIFKISVKPKKTKNIQPCLYSYHS